MDSCWFSKFLIFLSILNCYLDQLVLSSIIKDLMDSILSVDYTRGKMQEVLRRRFVTQKLSIISDSLVKTSQFSAFSSVFSV